MDNFTLHKGEQVQELIEQPGCELLYLPHYSPDVNPIGKVFSKAKRIVRKAGFRTWEALVEAMSAAIWAVTAKDVRSFFEHCGCRMSIQSL